MKKVVLIVALITLTVNSFAQKFTLNELVLMDTMSWSDFDIYARAKGYLFDPNDSTNSAAGKTYYFTGKNNHEYYIGKERSGKDLYIGVGTYKEDYLKINNEARAAGFNYNEDRTRSWEKADKFLKETSIIFSKGNMELHFRIQKEGIKDSIRKPNYVIGLTINK